MARVVPAEHRELVVQMHRRVDFRPTNVALDEQLRTLYEALFGADEGVIPEFHEPRRQPARTVADYTGTWSAECRINTQVLRPAMPWIREHTQTFTTTCDETTERARCAVARLAFEWLAAQLPKKRETAWSVVLSFWAGVLALAMWVCFFSVFVVLFFGVGWFLLDCVLLVCIMAACHAVGTRAEHDYLRVFRADGVIH